MRPHSEHLLHPPSIILDTASFSFAELFRLRELNPHKNRHWPPSPQAAFLPPKPYAASLRGAQALPGLERPIHAHPLHRSLPSPRGAATPRAREATAQRRQRRRRCREKLAPTRPSCKACGVRMGSDGSREGMDGGRGADQCICHQFHGGADSMEGAGSVNTSGRHLSWDEPQQLDR